MVSLDMLGPFELKESVIDKQVSLILPGNYALGYMQDGKTFIVKYIGRSDYDVNQRLKQHIDEYEHFKFSYAMSAKSAFDKECKNFHDFGESNNLDNQNHPDRPDGRNWECSECDIFD